MKEGFKEVNIRIENVENKVIIIEQEHGKKLDVLFDGYKQNGDKLDRIENEVSKHEEIILRRVRYLRRKGQIKPCPKLSLCYN